MAEKYTKEEIKETPVIAVKYPVSGSIPHAYFGSSIQDLFAFDKEKILGGIVTKAKEFDITGLQEEAWEDEIDILKECLVSFSENEGYVAFEYSIPRMGKRVDAILILNSHVIVLEFKVGEKKYLSADKNQVKNYVHDLHNFHAESHNIKLFPVLVATEAKAVDVRINIDADDGVADVICCNKNNLKDAIQKILDIGVERLDTQAWLNSSYKPTPTIIEAAQALYSGKDVNEISYAQGEVDDIRKTTAAIDSIIDDCKRNHKKAICFVTGVPGAGKTLVGLNIANKRHIFTENAEEHAIYLSGNRPLVMVLQEALAQDQNAKRTSYCRNCKANAKKNDKKVNIKQMCKNCEKGYNKLNLDRIRAKTISFIQIVHTYRDEAIADQINPPFDKIAIFDEAQRAWTKEALTKFMKKKKGNGHYSISEPECLIEYLNRHDDWACIVCLVGGGQEINKGEAGIQEWFHALNSKFKDWHVYYSDRMTGKEYLGNSNVQQLLSGMDNLPHAESCLHLSASKRSFRSENVSDFVKALIDCDADKAKELYGKITENDYYVYLTRDLKVAKDWVKSNSVKKGGRYGVIASSSAGRIRADGIFVNSGLDPKKWFLTNEKDINSSYFMELAASEFDIQGLEIDWSVLCWEADYRYDENEKNFTYNCLSGSKMQSVKKDINKAYLKNAYRVLLTRARQGMVIYIPRGNKEDNTRLPKFYDGTYKYLKDIIGIAEI